MVCLSTNFVRGSRYYLSSERERIDAARGHASAFVISRGVAVKSSRIKGGGSDQTTSVHLFTAEFHRPQSTRTNPERLEVCTSHTPSEQGFTQSRPNALLDFLQIQHEYSL
ncbi:hypothetical protein AVEN_229877-1 [Araneus ventricosus]|uniref:Uncharacterized protein n=1 Tax=Araneus ventricosus TaxID=182803 RepID=A0A4Y2HB60_ARAVE|nr:hypothetical protein AVEN_229877-1 [Araneus ventricosus]